MNTPVITTLKSLTAPLLEWYGENHRNLPWRKDRDPYRVWISEVMLQQTTVTAVIPYYERFLSRFPNIQSLAQSPLGEVLQLWTGLGYYSRARNLHAAAQELAQSGFPRSYLTLLTLPGFGPYTARAVSALAFSEKVGVLDGNVTRVLSRVLGLKIKHWTTSGRDQLQTFSDQLAQHSQPELVNQALMELGALQCTPKSPSCISCPWFQKCLARKANLVGKLPLKKPRKPIEIWLWNPTILTKGSKVGLIKNESLPFLKDQWVFPGHALQQKQRPKNFDVRHGITHHDIFIKICTNKQSRMDTLPRSKIQWVAKDKLSEWNPSILLKKILDPKPLG